MRKALVPAVAMVSFLAGALLSPLLSASTQQEAALLASLPSQLKHVHGSAVGHQPRHPVQSAAVDEGSLESFA